MLDFLYVLVIPSSYVWWRRPCLQDSLLGKARYDVGYCSLLHVDIAGWLLQAVVRDNVGFHGVVSFAIFSFNELAKVVLARAVNSLLVFFLNLLSRVAEHLTILNFLCLLGLWEARIEHVLIVLDDGIVAAELVVKSILSVRQNVSLVPWRRHVRLVSVWHGGHVVLAQIWVEGSLGMGWAVVGS